jgi:hypothetical protein
MKYIVMAVATMLMAALTFYIMVYMVTPQNITGSDTGSMIVKSFFLLIVAAIVVLAPIVALLSWWHNKENK